MEVLTERIKEVKDMRFSEKIKMFIEASANVISGNTNYPENDFIFDFRYSGLQTVADGKRMMKSDLQNFGADFKKATNEAKQHQQNGKTTPAK